MLQKYTVCFAINVLVIEKKEKSIADFSYKRAIGYEKLFQAILLTIRLLCLSTFFKHHIHSTRAAMLPQCRMKG